MKNRILNAYDLIIAAYIISIFSFENQNFGILFSCIQVVFIAFTGLVIITRKKIVFNLYIFLQLFLLVIALSLEIIIVQGSDNSNVEIYTFFGNIIKISFLIQYFITKKNIEKTIFFLVIGGITASIFIIKDYFAISESMTNLKYASFYRIGADVSGDNVNITAVNLCIAFSGGIYFLLKSKSNLLLFFYSLSSLVIFLAIIFTGSRKALIFCIIVFLFQFFSKGIKNAAMSISILIIAYISLMNVKVLYYFIGHKIDFFGELSTVNLYDKSDAIRKNLIDESLWIFSENFMGIGLGGVSNSIGIYSHNNFVEILASLGIVGFLFYYAIYLYPLIILTIQDRSVGMHMFFVSTIIGLLIIEWSQVTYLYKLPMLILALAISLISVNKREVVVSNEK